MSKTRTSDSIRVVRIIDRLNVGGPAKHVVWLTAALNHGEFDTVLITGTVPPGEATKKVSGTLLKGSLRLDGVW